MGGAALPGLKTRIMRHLPELSATGGYPNAGFQSIALAAEVKLAEARALSKTQTANKNVIVTTCVLMDELCRSLHWYNPILNDLKQELYVAIFPQYVRRKPDDPPADYANLDPYVTGVELLLGQRDKLENEINTFEDAHERTIEGARRRPAAIEQALNHWRHTTLAAAFLVWRSHHELVRVQTENFQDRMLQRYQRKQAKIVFQAWRQMTIDARRKKTEGVQNSLTELRSEYARLEKRCKELQFSEEMTHRKLRETTTQLEDSELALKKTRSDVVLVNVQWCALAVEMLSALEAEIEAVNKAAVDASTRDLRLVMLQDESLQIFEGIELNDLLFRWVNFHLDKSGHARRLSNFGTDLMDGVCYTVLLHQIAPSECNLDGLNKLDPTERVAGVIESLSKLGFGGIITAEEILGAAMANGNIQRLLLIELFLSRPCLFNEVCLVDTERELLSELRSTWVQRKNTQDTTPVSTEDLQRMMRMFVRCREDLASKTELIKQTLERFKLVKGRLDQETQVIFAMHLHGTTDADRAAATQSAGGDGSQTTLQELEIYTKVRFDRLRDVFSKEHDPQAEMGKVQQILVKSFGDLRKWYRHYARSGGMDRAEYWSFTKSCKLISASLNTALADLIYVKAATPDSKTEAGAAEDTDRELSASEFAECLVRIADVRSQQGPISDRLERLLEHDIRPRALQSDMDRFRREINAQPVRAVFAKHRSKLQKVFRFYASYDVRTDAAKKHVSTMNFAEFLAMIKDAGMMDASLNQGRLMQVFGNVQQDLLATQAEEQEPLDSTSELVYMEFLEALCALSVYRFPDPYMPLAQKVDQLCTQSIFARLAKTVRGLGKGK